RGLAAGAHAAGRGSGVPDRRPRRPRPAGAGARQLHPVAVTADTAARAGARTARRAAVPGAQHTDAPPLSPRLMKVHDPAPLVCLASASARRDTRAVQGRALSSVAVI